MARGSILDCLIEVWSQRNGSAGKSVSGWALSPRCVLTVGHVVRDCAKIQVRAAKSASAEGWIDAKVHWRHPTLDVALLKVLPGPAGDGLPGSSSSLAATGDRECSAEAVGFPEAEAKPKGRRDTEQASGKLHPSGRVRREDGLIPFDVDGSVPDDARLWKGISGAPVHDEHGRLVAIVAEARPDHQQRRLLVLPVERIAQDDGFARAAEELDLDLVVEDPRAPLWKSCTAPGLLARSGKPIQVCEADLKVFGVHEAVAGDAGDGAFPKYLPRDKDPEIVKALAETSNGGRRVVLVIGDSAAGKSRSAAQAALSIEALRERALVLPDRQGLARLIDERAPLENTLVWLDDIDKHLSNGLAVSVLERLLAEVPDVVVLCTVRRSQLQERQDGTDPVWQFLTDERIVSRIDLPGGLSDKELEDARNTFSSSPFLLDALDRGVGLGEYLVGGPELVKKLKLATGYKRHLADVAIGWYRTGLNQPTSLSELCRLWTETFPESLAASYRELTPRAQEEKFDQALKWACEPVLSRDEHDVVLLLERREGYEANDYVVDHISKQRDRPAIGQPLWDAALRVARSEPETENDRLWQVGGAAIGEEQHEVVVAAMNVLAKDEDFWGMMALHSKSVALVSLKRLEEALAACGEVVERFGKTKDPEIREWVTKALVGRGIMLGELGRLEEALAAYEEAVRRFGEAEEPAALRMEIAMALFNKGGTLGELKRPEEALAAYGEVVERFGNDQEPTLREEVAKALVNKGVALSQLERPEEELVAYGEVVERFGNDQEPTLRELAARALFYKAITLSELGRLGETLAVCGEVVERFGETEEPGLSEAVTWARSALDEFGESADRSQ